jgi:hypothetical protein
MKPMNPYRSPQGPTATAEDLDTEADDECVSAALETVLTAYD